MMKKELISGMFVLVTGMSVLQAQENDRYVIRGMINGEYKAEKVYLVKEEESGRQVIDSCTVEDKRYYFEGQKPVFIGKYFIKSAVKNSSSPYAEFFLDADTIQIVTDGEFFANSKVTGGVDNLLVSYNKFLTNCLIDSMKYEFFLNNAIHGEQDEATEMEGLRKRSEIMTRRHREIMIKLASKYTDCVYTAYLLNGPLRRMIPLDQVKALRSRLAPELSDHPFIRELDAFLRLSEFGVGSEMPDISCPDARGKMVHLKDFRGKYVLVDFWASWCGPCIKEMPTVIQLYKECKGKNFEILGVSLDSTKEAWLAMVKKQGMKWPQVCDFKAWHSPAAQACGIQSVPSTILVGPDGKVVALNLRGEQLIQKVKEVLNTH